MGDQKQKAHNPIATGAIVGLGWGLALGLVDGLFVLLEGNLAIAPGRRLLTLTYVMVFYAILFGLVLALVGVIVWAISRWTRRQMGHSSLLGLCLGLCSALSAGAFVLQRYQDASWIVALGLGLSIGLAVGGLVRAATRTGPAGFASIGKGTRTVILSFFAIGVVILLTTGIYHQVIRDLPALNPRVTDQVATPERPNIVLISIDALRADRLGIYGNDPGVSPHIDDLARRGVVFRQAVAQASSTVPSVASFLTSLHPTEAGMISGRSWFVDELRVTLAEALQVAGYRTQAYVTNGHLVPANGYAQGFDGYVPPEPNRPYGLDRVRGETIVTGLACRHLSPVCALFDGGYKLLFDRLLVMENEGWRVSNLARRFIRLHDDEQFFLWLHYMEPHSLYTPNEPFGDLPPSVDAERESSLRSWQPSNKTWPLVMRPDDLDAVISLYDGEVLDVDRLVGGIWDELQARGLADRTLLVITADHGDEFGEHEDYGHGHTVYQDVTWVPLIFAGPQVTSSGRVVETPVPLLNLMPTLLDVAGAPLPDPIRGESLLPVLQGGDPIERAIYSECPARRSAYDDKALRQGDYKLVYNVKLDQRELYNLETDPGEQHDLSAGEPGRAAAMRDELRTWTSSAIETWASLPQAGSQATEMDEAMEKALQRIGY